MREKLFVGVLSLLLMVGLWGCSEISSSAASIESIAPNSSTASAAVSVPMDPLEEKLEILRRATNEELINYCYQDFDNDGDLELFAFVGDVLEDVVVPIYKGEVWFVGENGAQLLQSGGGFISCGTVFDFYIAKVFAIDWFKTTSNSSYLWCVQDGQPVETNLFGRVGGVWVDENGALCIAETVLDSASENGRLMGRTLKKYYLFYEDGQFWEYGGLPVTLEQLLEQDGAEEILIETIAADDWQSQISEIYYRENGIIHINYHRGHKDNTHFRNITLVCKDGVVTLADASDGIYKAAYLPDLATYPNAAFD